MLAILTVFILTYLNLWFQPENSRFEVRDCSPRTSRHAQWLKCCKNTSGWRPWYQERLVLKFPNFRDLGATDPLSAASFSNGGTHQNYECGNPGGYFRNFWVGM